MKTALIVVDVQYFFLHSAPNDLPKNIANHIDIESYDVVAFTVFKNTPSSNFVRSLKWNKCFSEDDTKLPDKFKPYISSDNVFTRNTYSGFTGTSLHEFLQNNDVQKVVLCGIDTDACVLATAFSAFDNGYLVDVDFELTFSGGGLEKEAQAIIRRSLQTRGYPEIRT
jgi:nicotinamidase-related amidase